MSADKPAMRAVLRDVDGNHITNLCASEIDRFNAQADRGLVIRSQKMKKGRMTLIFRFKAVEQLKPAEPSKSRNSDVMLTDRDSMGLAHVLGVPTNKQRERWIGWGLLPGDCTKVVVVPKSR